MNLDAIIQTLTLEEKVNLLSGKDNWNLNVPLSVCNVPMMLTDGPHGIRKQEIDPLTKNEITAKATCFPTASLVSCSWDKDVFSLLGDSIAKEAAALDVAVVLGPGLNIKKSGYNGRNFEYISEDPLLTGKLASAYIQAAEARGVGTCVKHFALNNYETRRMSTNVVVDQRAFKEIYLKGFEIAICDGKPTSVMSSYNRVNKEYASEHTHLLSEVLRKEWKYTGVVMSDWGAVNDRLLALKATLDLEMPGPSRDNKQKLLEAVQNKTISIEEVDESVKRVLQIVELNPIKAEVEFEKHHEIAKYIASESIVLLKNKKDLLPLHKETKISVIGELAKQAPIQGAGSSLVNPTKVTSFLEVLEQNQIEYSYHKGYDLYNELEKSKWIQEAIEVAQRSEVVVLFLGLDLPGDSEGQDRESLQIPKNQLKVLQRLVRLNKPIVVILSGGTSVVMPWDDQVDSILYTGLYGQNGASAVYDLVYGLKSPSGKLSLTFLQKEEDDVFFKKDIIKSENVLYKDSIFVGYRYFSSVDKPVRYAFGHGLSYTKFKYTKCEIQKLTLQETEKLEISIKVQNVGNYVAKEVIQLYIENKQTDVLKPKLELKDFQKVELMPNEEKEVTFNISNETFQHFCTTCIDWKVAAGTYIIHFGSASDDLRIQYEIEVISHHLKHKKDAQYFALYKTLPNQMRELDDIAYLDLFDQNPLFKPLSKYHENTTLYDIKHTIVGRIMLRMIQKEVRKWAIAKNPVQMRMIEASALHTPLRALKNMSGGKFTDSHMEGVILWAKKNYIKSLKKMLFSKK